MRPENPELVTPEAANGYRITVPQRLVPSWARTDGSVRLVPLLWKRDLALPDGHQLEAWFVWSENDSSEEWLTDPRTVLEAEAPSVAVHHLQTLMYPASFVTSDRKSRLSCAGVLKYLTEKSGGKLWITDERGSVGVMTDFAFHTAYGKLQL
jgi:hypothetical protein